MMVLAIYDVNRLDPKGAARLQRVAKIFRPHGKRVQSLVFEIEIDPAECISLKSRVEKIIDSTCDSLRYYYLGTGWKNCVEHIG